MSQINSKPGPTMFKPGWAGFRQEKDELFKDIAVELRVDHVGPLSGNGPNIAFSFPPDENSSHDSGEWVGQLNPRPPDPFNKFSTSTPPGSNRSIPSSKKLGHGGGAQGGSGASGAEGDDLMHEESWADCEAEEDMEATPSLG